jgi:hypothetical protein
VLAQPKRGRDGSERPGILGLTDRDLVKHSGRIVELADVELAYMKGFVDSPLRYSSSSITAPLPVAVCNRPVILMREMQVAAGQEFRAHPKEDA